MCRYTRMEPKHGLYGGDEVMYDADIYKELSGGRWGKTQQITAVHGKFGRWYNSVEHKSNGRK